MPEHQYNAEQALEVLMRKLKNRDEALAVQIQAAIDAGKDIRETEPSADGRRKPRVYRKTVPFTHEEALQVAIDALQAYFVEQPLFVKSAAQNFAKTGLDNTRRRIRSRFEPTRLNSAKERSTISIGQVDEAKVVEVELQTETQIEKSGPETELLAELEDSQIEKRKRQVNELRKLANFQMK